MDPTFQPHEIRWTNEKSARLWTFFGSQATHEDAYFSKAVGNRLLNYVRKDLSLSGRILDFGCGPGFLLERLLARGIAAEGLDFSKDSVESAHRRLSAHPSFRGVRHAEGLPTPLADASYDLVFFVETIEHVLPDVLEETLSELSRVLRAGGRIVVTTPNREDLAANTVMCPECGCTFHRIQHVTAWSAEGLAAAMQRHGFRTVSVRETTLRRDDILNEVFRLGFSVLGKTQPNLVYIGEKTASSPAV